MNIKHILNKHRLEAFVVLFLIVVATLYFSNQIIAQAPYIAPGPTEPGCPSTDPTCIVYPIAIGSNIGLSTTAGGSILFTKADSDADGFAELEEDNANLFWDAAEKRLGIGTAIPGVKLEVRGIIRAASGNRIVSLHPQFLALIASGKEWRIQTDANGDNLLFEKVNSGTIMSMNKDGNVGIGTSDPSARLTIGSDGAITTTEKDLGSISANITVSWNDGNQQRVELTGSITTITFDDYIAGQTLRLIVCQDVTGSRIVTNWKDSDTNDVLWNGGSAPTLTTTASRCDVLTFLATKDGLDAGSDPDIFGSSVLDFAP